MNFHLFKAKKTIFKDSKNPYKTYVILSMVLLSILPILKTLLDLNILLTTGRMVGTDDGVNLMFIKKEKRALQISPHQQKILIISGSNGSYGISAQTISQETGIEAVNLSTNAPLGGEYILKRAEKFINKGDIIILPLEYSFYHQKNSSTIFSTELYLGRFMFSYDQNSLKDISKKSILRFWVRNISDPDPKGYLSYFMGDLSKEKILTKIEEQTNNCYQFNSYGDILCNVGKENLPTKKEVLLTAMSPTNQELDPGGYIDRFVQFAKRKGATIIPLYPVSTLTKDYEKVDFKQFSEKIKKFWQNKEINFHDSLNDSLLPSRLMYNSSYHPNESGRKIRTKKVIEIIKKSV